MRYATIVLVLLLSGCHVGGRAIEYPPARLPNGVSGEVRVGRQLYRGELLEVRDSAFVLAAGNELVHIPYRKVSGFLFDHGFDVRVARPADFFPSQMTKLRLHSRFPYGLPAVALEVLLQERGQTRITNVQAP